MITPPAVAPAGARVFEARRSYVTAVRLSADNVEAVQLWMRGETGADGIWNDHALYFTTPTGLAQANEGDWVVQTILGFEVYNQTAFVAKFDQVVQQPPIFNKVTEPSVATHVTVSQGTLSNDEFAKVVRRYANPLCGQHKDSAQFEGKQMVARVPLVEHQLTDILARHAEATEER
jgi:hypothetical protein